MDFLSLPNDILIDILLQLNCKQIIFIQRSCTKLSKLILDNKILEQRKIEGYPRKEGHCLSYSVPTNIISKMPYLTFDTIILLATNYIYANVSDIIKGDIVRIDSLYNQPIAFIFDGMKLVDLLYYLRPFSRKFVRLLPTDFCVIENNVPLNYWGRNIVSNIWFNHVLVRQQCLDNMTFTEYNKLCTTFTFNELTYSIYYEKDYILNDKNRLEKFKQEILSDTKIMFSCNTSDAYRL